jgi:hypothetical protein
MRCGTYSMQCVYHTLGLRLEHNSCVPACVPYIYVGTVARILHPASRKVSRKRRDVIATEGGRPSSDIDDTIHWLYVMYHPGSFPPSSPLS